MESVVAKEAEMKKFVIVVFLFLICVSVCVFMGCQKKVAAQDQIVVVEEKKAESKGALSSDMKITPDEVKVTNSRHEFNSGLPSSNRVLFDFDSARIREESKIVIADVASQLRDNPFVNLRIEGNCDERGTREYNLKLGRERAKSAKHLFVSLGVHPRRISIVTYGKDKPLCTENTERCHQANRRDEFVLSVR